MTEDITYSTRRILSEVRVIPQDDAPARLIFKGSIVNTEDGEPLQAFEQDVTDNLDSTHAAGVASLVAQAQTWLDAHPS